jgi:CRP/FNR family transcriptional regulator, cyclic AMP receptor protein
MGRDGTDSGVRHQHGRIAPSSVTAAITDDQVQAVVELRGAFERDAAAQVVDAIARVLAADVGEIHLDLRAVAAMSPSAIPTLVHVRRRAARHQVGLRLVLGPGPASEALGGSGLARGFTVVATLPPQLAELLDDAGAARPVAADPWPRERPIATDHADAARWVHVLREDEDLARGLAPELLDEACHRLRARELVLRRGALPTLPRRGRLHVGLLVLDGLVARRVGGPGGFSAELLGPGDVLRVGPHPGEETCPWLATDVRTLTAVRLAVLDGAFAEQAGRYSPVLPNLVERALARAHALSVSLAVAHYPRVEQRLLVLLWQLAQRFGRVTPEGVVLRLPLTHALLADLSAARRPSVTIALQHLEARGLVRRHDGDVVLLDTPDRLGPTPRTPPR